MCNLTSYCTPFACFKFKKNDKVTIGVVQKNSIFMFSFLESFSESLAKRDCW